MQNASKNYNEHQEETIIQLKNTKQTVRHHLSLKVSKECSNCQRWILFPVFLPCLLNKNAQPPAEKVSILAEEQIVWHFLFHCRRFLSAQSFATLVLSGTIPLAAMDCCSSVTHTPKQLGFFRLSDSLFLLADLKEECSRHRLLLQPFASSPFHCKNA